MYSCESPHSAAQPDPLDWHVSQEGRFISKDATFDRCVVLSDDAFDPDAVFLDDIVDDGVLPYPDLRVDGLTSASPADSEEFEVRPDDASANEEHPPDTRLPHTSLGSQHLGVYGWENSLWRKIRAYLGF